MLIASYFSHTVLNFAIKPGFLTVKEGNPILISNFPAVFLNHKLVQFIEETIYYDTFSQRECFLDYPSL